MSEIARRLADLGITLPKPAAPVANYVPFILSDRLLIVSGQLPLDEDGKIAPHHIGKFGATVTVPDAYEAARLCVINVLAQAQLALGSLDLIVRTMRLGGYINASPGNSALPAVMNGASDQMVAVLGDKGRHARTTVGVAELPLGAVVEVEAMFEVEA